MEQDRSLKEPRGNTQSELKSLSAVTNVEAELQDITLYKLLKSFQNVMLRFEQEQQRPVHQVVEYPYTIEGQKSILLDKLLSEGKLSFIEVIEYETTKIAVIFNFLAILELLQLRQITLHLGLGFNNFWIEKLEEALVD
jgi:segregation and condensation protein A